MGKSLEYDYKVCDIVLKFFDDIPDGRVTFEQVNKAQNKVYLSDRDEVYSFLVEEGLLKETAYGYEITHKGRITIHKGGLWRQALRANILHVCTLVAAVSGVIAAIAGIFSIFFI